MNRLEPKDFVITRKRKKYKFALFFNSPLCFEVDQWRNNDPKPVSLEIGAGTGLFSVASAENNRDRQYVAIDVKADRLQTGARLAEQTGLTNIRFLRARADQLPELLNAHSLDDIWITFPDPFPKDRYEKHRLTHPRFLEIYGRLLKKDGALYFKTDSRPLFDWSMEQLVAAGWHIEHLTFDLHDSELPAHYKQMTTYETRYANEGLKISFLKAMPPV